MNCGNCGKEIEASSRFCPFCGVDLAPLTSSDNVSNNGPMFRAPKYEQLLQQLTYQNSGYAQPGGNVPQNQGENPEKMNR